MDTVRVERPESCSLEYLGAFEDRVVHSEEFFPAVFGQTVTGGIGFRRSHRQLILNTRWRMQSMASRLWNNPPVTPDGTLDYAQLTTAEVAEDLFDGLFDRIMNGGHEELTPFFEQLEAFCPDFEDIPAEPRPTPTLVAVMDELLRLEASDCNWSTPRSRELLGVAVEQLRSLIGGGGRCPEADITPNQRGR